MDEMTVEKALADLVDMLTQREGIVAEALAKTDKLDKQVAKCSAWLYANSGDGLAELPVALKSLAPYINWKLGKKTDDSAVDCYRTLRDVTKKQITAATKDSEELVDAHIDEIAAWLLLQLDSRGATNTKTDFGTASRVTKVQAKVVDLTSLVRWAVEHGEEEILEARAKSKVVEAYFDAHSEYPPFLNLVRKFDIVVRKPSV